MPADAAVHFGPGLASQVGVLGLATEHAILVTGLDPANTYAFEALSRDASGNAGAVAVDLGVRAGRRWWGAFSAGLSAKSGDG